MKLTEEERRFVEDQRIDPESREATFHDYSGSTIIPDGPIGDRFGLFSRRIDSSKSEEGA